MRRSVEIFKGKVGEWLSYLEVLTGTSIPPVYIFFWGREHSKRAAHLDFRLGMSFFSSLASLVKFQNEGKSVLLKLVE